MESVEGGHWHPNFCLFVFRDKGSLCSAVLELSLSTRLTLNSDVCLLLPLRCQDLKAEPPLTSLAATGVIDSYVVLYVYLPHGLP